MRSTHLSMSLSNSSTQNLMTFQPRASSCLFLQISETLRFPSMSVCQRRPSTSTSILISPGQTMQSLNADLQPHIAVWDQVPVFSAHNRLVAPIHCQRHFHL